MVYISIQMRLIFDFLPNFFVIKTNHDWGGVVVVNNKAEFLADSSKK